MVPTPLVVPGPDCFTVSIWTDVPVSGFVLHKYIFIVVIPLCCLVYTFMSIWMSMRKCFRAIPPFLVFLWSNISLPKTETSRSPFPGFDFFDQKWSPSAPFLSLPVRFGGHLRNMLCFSRISLWNPYVIDPWFYNIFHCVPAWFNCLPTGRQINFRLTLPRSLELSRSLVQTPPLLQTYLRTDMQGRLRPAPLTRHDPYPVTETCLHRPPGLYLKGVRTPPMCLLLRLRRRNHTIHISSAQDVPRWTQSGWLCGPPLRRHSRTLWPSLRSVSHYHALSLLTRDGYRPL